jgi:hypothetical protein
MRFSWESFVIGLIGFLIITFAATTLTGCGKKYNTTVIDGTPGEKGEKGDPGTNGQNGEGCDVQSVAHSVELPHGGAIVTCGTHAVLISNGAPGEDAEVTQYTITQKIDPCGNAPGIFDELLLVFADGSLLATVSDNANGKNTRLAEVPDGSWTTTDDSGCNFTVSTSGSMRSVFWSNGGISWSL